MKPRFACFFHRGQSQIGWLRETRGKRLKALLTDGTEVKLHPGAVLHQWEGGPGGEEESDPRALLHLLQAAVAAHRERVERLHAGLAQDETPQALSFDELVRGAFPSGIEAWERGAFFAALLADDLHFAFQNGRFTPRTAAEAANRANRAGENRRLRELERRAGKWRAQLEAGRWERAGDGPGDGVPGNEAPGDGVPAEEEAEAEFLAGLKSLLAHGRQSSHWPSLARPLGLHSLAPADLPPRLKGWLATAGAWPGWPAIWLEAAGLRPDFDPSLEEAAARLAAAPVAVRGRADYRHLPAHTVDAEGTRDLDDAVSIVEARRDHLLVAVHIAEPSPGLLPGHPLFDEAERRMATAYNLEGVFPMLPASLSEGRLSLLRGMEREAVSFVFRLAGGEAELERIERAVVRVEANLTPEQAQRLIDDEPDSWGRLALACAGLADARADRGAWIPDRREVVIDLSHPSRIRVSEKARIGPAHRIVEELAVLTNQAAAGYFRAHGLPGIYRVQAAPEGEEASAGESSPAWFSPNPAPHAGLGCPHYMQATSPIRRFADLVMQRQLTAHLAGGGPCFSDPVRIAEWCARADQRQELNNTAARRIANDAKRRYLLQNSGLLFDAVVRRRPEGGAGRIWLEALQLNAHCPLPPTAREGDRLRVRVESVDRDRETVWAAVNGD